MAAYAARAGLQAHIFMPKDTPYANIEESRMAGAEVILVNGLISDAAGMAGEKARAEGWFDVSTFKEPYRVEGKKTLGYELAEQLKWELPDVIVYPTGGGTGLIGMWKAFEEMERMGWIGSKRPRMVTVQAAGCAPIVRAFEARKRFADEFPNAATTASGRSSPWVSDMTPASMAQPLGLRGSPPWSRVVANCGNPSASAMQRSRLRI